MHALEEKSEPKLRARCWRWPGRRRGGQRECRRGTPGSRRRRRLPQMPRPLLTPWPGWSSAARAARTTRRRCFIDGSHRSDRRHRGLRRGARFAYGSRVATGTGAGCEAFSAARWRAVARLLVMIIVLIIIMNVNPCRNMTALTCSICFNILSTRVETFASSDVFRHE